MANNYCLSSSFLNIPKDKIEEAKKIVSRVREKMEVEDPDFGCECESDIEDDGVWFHYDESIDIEAVEAIARALIEELKLNNPFYCSWANTCSMPRINAFSGGAFMIKRGYETYWINPFRDLFNASDDKLIPIQGI